MCIICDTVAYYAHYFSPLAASAKSGVRRWPLEEALFSSFMISAREAGPRRARTRSFRRACQTRRARTCSSMGHRHRSSFVEVFDDGCGRAMGLEHGEVDGGRNHLNVARFGLRNTDSGQVAWIFLCRQFVLVLTSSSVQIFCGSKSVLYSSRRTFLLPRDVARLSFGRRSWEEPLQSEESRILPT